MNLAMIVPGIPSVDPLPLAGPPALFHTLLILTSVLHLLAMNLLLGGRCSTGGSSTCPRSGWVALAMTGRGVDRLTRPAAADRRCGDVDGGRHGAPAGPAPDRDAGTDRLRAAVDHPQWDVIAVFVALGLISWMVRQYAPAVPKTRHSSVAES